MSGKNDNQKFVNMINVGNFTKNAVENFEENIVNQKDYLEKVKDKDKKIIEYKVYKNRDRISGY